MYENPGELRPPAADAHDYMSKHSKVAVISLSALPKIIISKLPAYLNMIPFMLNVR